MNERIKELADEAAKFSAVMALPIGESGDRLFVERFAELIVQECIECTKEWRDAVRAESTNDYSQGYVHGCDDAIVEMKTRFGVEE